VLGVDECRDAAILLHVCGDGQGERRLARRLGTEDLDHSSFRKTAAAERQIETKRPGRDTLDSGKPIPVEGHDGALAMSLLNLREGSIERLATTGIKRRRAGSGLFLQGRLGLATLGLRGFLWSRILRHGGVRGDFR
jgi:hypothetical protein